MIKRLKREFEEINSAKEHMEEPVLEEGSSADHLNVLRELSKRVNAGYKVEGTPEHFFIKCRSLNILLATTWIIMLLISGVGLMNDLKALVPFTAVLIAAPLMATYMPTTNTIEVDSRQQRITISSNNFIGRYTRKVRRIHFREYQGLENLLKKRGGRSSQIICKVYLKSNRGRFHLISLHHGPLYYLNYKKLMHSLDKIIAP